MIANWILPLRAFIPSIHAFTRAWVILFLVSLITSHPICAQLEREEERIKTIVEQQSQQPIDEYTIFRAPSYPKPAQNVIPEWETVDYLVIAIPYDDAVLNESILSFYMAIIREALRVTDVIVLLHEQELTAFKELIKRSINWNIVDHLEGKAKTRIHLLPSRIDTKWIRDYGPLFLRARDGSLLFADAIYREVRTERDMSNSIESYLRVNVTDHYDQEQTIFFSESEDRVNDDSFAMYLTRFIHMQREIPIDIVRVPFLLCGGDFMADDQGNYFTSYETLFMNGGHRRDFELILKHYYAMNSITYLDSLPGDTIKHVDMFFKTVDENTFLIAEYPQITFDRDVYMNYLHKQAQHILTKNTERLQQKFPERRIVKMPMPPLKRTPKHEEFALTHIMKFFESKGYDLPEIIEANPKKWTFEYYILFYEVITRLFEDPEEEIYTHLQEILEPDTRKEFSEEERLLNALVVKLIKEDKALLKWIVSPYAKEESSLDNDQITKWLNKLIDDYVFEGIYDDPMNYNYIYQTYLNATYINGAHGQMLLVPRYQDSLELEPEVRRIYQDLYPNCEIVFIPSDEIIKQSGAIHCVTLTIPKLN